MNRVIIFLLLFSVHGFSQTRGVEQDLVYVPKSPSVSPVYHLPKFDSKIHLPLTTLKLANDDVFMSTGIDWLQMVDGTSGASDGKTIKGNGTAESPYKNGWSVDYESEVNGARFVQNTTASNLVYFLTADSDYLDGDLIFARASNTGSLTLQKETSETYTINGLTTNFIIPKLTDAIFQYDETQDNWAVIGGSIITQVVLTNSGKMARMVNKSTPATDYNNATFTVFDQWDSTTPQYTDGIYSLTDTRIRSLLPTQTLPANYNRFRVRAMIHLTCSVMGGKVRAEVFVDGVTTGSIFFSTESTTNSDDITVSIDEIVEVPFFKDVEIKLQGAGNATGTITTGAVGSSYFELVKTN